MFKNILGLPSEMTSTIFIRRSENNRNIYHINDFKILSKSLSYVGPKTWYTIPTETKNTSSLNCLQKSVKDWNLQIPHADSARYASITSVLLKFAFRLLILAFASYLYVRQVFDIFMLVLGPAEERKSDWKWIKERRIQNTRWERFVEKAQMSRILNGHRIRQQP